MIDSLGGENLEKSLTVLKPGGQAIGVTGPPDPAFAKQLGAPKFMGVAMGLLSRKIRKQARKLGVRYSFLWMQANGAQLRELAALYDAARLRPLIDKTFPFDQTREALAYVEPGRADGKSSSRWTDNRRGRSVSIAIGGALANPGPGCACCSPRLMTRISDGSPWGRCGCPLGCPLGPILVDATSIENEKAPP